MIEYEELRVRVWQIGRDRYLVLVNGPTSAAAGVRIAPDHRYRQSFAELLDEEFRRTEGSRATVHERIRALGEQLFGVLFPGPIHACLLESARRADQHGRSLRIRFELAPELGDIPTEILWGPHPYGKLAGHHRFSLTRTVQGSGLSPRRLPAATSSPEKFRVLVVVAEPRGGSAVVGGGENRLLDLGAEVAALQEALTAGPRRAAVTVETLGWPRSARTFTRPTLVNLRAALARHPEMPCAVVLLGHGTGGDGVRGGQVLLEKRDGSADPVTGERLAADVAAAPGVRLVVLNLCAGAQTTPGSHPHSAVAHELIARGIPAVVAMQADVSNTAATRFTPALFTAIAANGSVDEAVATARQDMVNTRDETTLEWATPVLMLHHQCRHGWLFKAVKVVKGAVPADPLAKGQQAIEEVEHPPDGVVQIDALVEASRFTRLLGDWEQVVRFADMGRDVHPEPLEWLAQEARLELALERCRTICDILAKEDDPGRAHALLDGLRTSVPDEVFDCLAAEVNRAAKAFATLTAATQAAAADDWEPVLAYCDEILGDLPDGYRDAATLRQTAVLEIELDTAYQEAQQHRGAERWAEAEEAYDKVLGRRPDGYRDALGWRAYCQGRQADAAGDTAAAATCYAEAIGFADTDGRIARCRAVLAEAADDWEVAVPHYEAAQQHGVEVGPDLRYATAARAAARGEWPLAAEVFRSLPERYRDAGHLARFAAGRAAQDRQDWAGVLHALGGLPAEFHDGEVGRMRGIARAHLAVAEGRWGAVPEALRGLDDHTDDDHTDAVRHLLDTARCRLADDRGDWPAFVAACRRMRNPAPDLAALLPYATGRVAEADRNWAQALAAYRQARTVRDAALRCDYAEGCAAEEAGNWPDAERLFGGLPREFEDAGLRAGYARIRSAAGRQDWPVVVHAADEVEGYRDAPRLAGYGRARLAEAEEDWRLATDLFEQSGMFEDATARATYARGRAMEAEGRWSRAQQYYESLPDDHRDVGVRRTRLTTLTRTIRWADGLGDVSLVPDPGATARDNFPYRVLAPLGISPESSMQDIKDAGMRVLRGNQGAARQVAADLRSWVTRLALDAGLYPVRDSTALRRALRALTQDETAQGEAAQGETDQGDGADPYAQLCAAAPQDAPLLALLHVDREEAIAAWEERLRADPGDSATAHCLAIAYRWAARDLDQAGAWEHGRVAWQRCIGLWVTALGDEEYWEQWRRARSARYRFMVPVPEVRKLRGAIIADLSAELDGAAAQHAQNDRPALAEQYHTLSLAVRVEMLGRDVLAELGGVPPPGRPDARVVGGPAYLGTVGLSEAVAQLAAELVHRADDELSEPDPASEDGEPALQGAPELLTRLCAAFSRLGPALALLESGRPERALAMLPDLHRRRLADVTRDPGCGAADHPAGEVAHHEPCPACLRFLSEDPAYLHLGGRAARLLQDSARIAIQCHLKVARAAAFADDQAGIDNALRAAGAALDVASTAGLAARARPDVADFVVESAEALWQPGASRGPRLDRAVELVARVRAELGLGNDERIRKVHAEALYHRAQWIALGEDQDTSTDHDRAIADLREAIRISSASLMARVGLAHTLVQRSVERPWAGRHETAVAEALTVVCDGLRVAPGHVPLLEAVEAVAKHVRQVVYRTLDEARLLALEPPGGLPNESRNDMALRLARYAARADSTGDRVTAVLLGVDAVLADPKEPLARDSLVTIVTRWATAPADGRSTP